MIFSKKHLGQNFLIDKNIVNKILQMMEGSLNNVLEVGTGTGALTFKINERAKEFIGVEIDSDLVKLINSENNKINIINIDFLKLDIKKLIGNKKFTFVSNLPYYISTKILFKISEYKNFQKIFVMLQHDLVKRILSKEGSKDYGKLTVSINSLFLVKDHFIVKGKSFLPVPKVSSAFIFLERKKIVEDEKGFLEFVKKSFGQRRKFILNNFRGEKGVHREIELWLQENSKSVKIRPEQLSTRDYISIWERIKSIFN